MVMTALPRATGWVRMSMNCCCSWSKSTGTRLGTPRFMAPAALVAAIGIFMPGMEVFVFDMDDISMPAMD